MESKPGCLGTLGRVLAGLLAVVVALTLPVAVLARNVGVVVFSPRQVGDLIVSRVVDQGLVRQAIRELVFSRELMQGGEGEGFDFGQAISYLEPVEVELLMDVLLPPDWAVQQLRRSLTDLYAWLDNDQERPNLVLDLGPLKAGLIGGGAARMVEIVIDSWPSCTGEEVDRLEQAFLLGGDVSIVYCEPSEPIRSRLAEEATAAFVQQFEEMPSHVPLFEPGGDAPGGSREAALAFKEQLRLVRALSQWGWILPLSLLGIIMVLAVRSFRGLSRWWGVPLLAAGLLTFLTAYLASAYLRQAILPSLQAAQGTERAAVPLVVALLDGLAKEVLARTVVHAVLLSGGAILLLVLGFVFGRRRRPTEPAASVTADASATVPSPDAQTIPPRTPLDDREPPTGMFG